jgi:hypothetical protein
MLTLRVCCSMLLTNGVADKLVHRCQPPVLRQRGAFCRLADCRVRAQCAGHIEIGVFVDGCSCQNSYGSGPARDSTYEFKPVDIRQREIHNGQIDFAVLLLQEIDGCRKNLRLAAAFLVRS